MISSPDKALINKTVFTSSVLVHNHPSGDPSPSKDDIAMTREVAAAADKLGITLHDHLIIGRKGHASLKSMGLI